MKFELEQNNKGVSDEDLLADIRRCANALGTDSITMVNYGKTGRFPARTIQKRMGTWNKALQTAGLQITRHIDSTDEDLFENVKLLWIKLGRQPRYSEMKRPESLFSPKPYTARFGSWLEALRRFVDWVNTDESEPTTLVNTSQSESETGKSKTQLPSIIRRSRRDPSDRQRFRILVRDGFKCRSCGASPLVQHGVELHVDHIIPWANGGETIDENLETKCKKCNLGKGAAFNV